MGMSKRHFEAVAAEVRRARTLTAETEGLTAGEHAAADTALVELAHNLADVFARENGNFDRSRFRAACDGEDSFDMAGRTVRYSGDPYGTRVR